MATDKSVLKIEKQKGSIRCKVVNFLLLESGGQCGTPHILDLYLGELQGNGVQSYRRVFPRAKYQSAKASASRLLKKPSVKQAMKHKLDKMESIKES